MIIKGQQNTSFITGKLYGVSDKISVLELSTVDDTAIIKHNGQLLRSFILCKHLHYSL